MYVTFFISWDFFRYFSKQVNTDKIRSRQRVCKNNYLFSEANPLVEAKHKNRHPSPAILSNLKNYL